MFPLQDRKIVQNFKKISQFVSPWYWSQDYDGKYDYIFY